MSFYLALDVGGTKTAALLADETRILGRAVGGSIKTLRVAPEEAARSLAEVLGELEAQSGLKQSGLKLRGAVLRTCIGTSGAGASNVRGWLQAAFAEAVGGELLLLGDEVIGLDAAFHGGRGALVIAGTGSNIVGRASTGQMAHTGGWGPALADEGSGHWIGTEALRACFRAIDAAAPSTADSLVSDGSSLAVKAGDLPELLRRMMAALSVSELGDVIGRANAPGFQTARLVPVVVEAARAGDAIGAAVLARAGQDLADLVAAVIRKIGIFEAAAGGASVEGERFTPPDVAFVGGVLANIREVREAMQQALRARYPGIVLQNEAVDPLEGALWHARRGQSCV